MLDAIKQIVGGLGSWGENRQPSRFVLGLGLFVGLGGWLALDVNRLFFVLPLGWIILVILALRQRHLAEHWLAGYARKREQRLLREANRR